MIEKPLLETLRALFASLEATLLLSTLEYLDAFDSSTCSATHLQKAKHILKSSRPLGTAMARPPFIPYAHHFHPSPNSDTDRLVRMSTLARTHLYLRSSKNTKPELLSQVCHALDEGAMLSGLDPEFARWRMGRLDDEAEQRASARGTSDVNDKMVASFIMPAYTAKAISVGDVAASTAGLLGSSILRSKLQDFQAYGIKLYITPSRTAFGTPANQERNFPLGASSSLVATDEELQKSLYALFDSELRETQVAAFVIELPKADAVSLSEELRDTLASRSRKKAEDLRKRPSRQGLRCIVTGSGSSTCELTRLIDPELGAERFEVVAFALAASWAAAADRSEHEATRSFYESLSGQAFHAAMVGSTINTNYVCTTSDIQVALFLPELLLRPSLNNLTHVEPTFEAQLLFLNGLAPPPPLVERSEMDLPRPLKRTLLVGVYFKMLLSFSTLWLGGLSSEVLDKAYGTEKSAEAAAAETSGAATENRQIGLAKEKGAESGSKKRKMDDEAGGEAAKKSSSTTSSSAQGPPASSARISHAKQGVSNQSVNSGYVRLEEARAIKEMKVATEDLGSPWLARLLSTTLAGAANPKGKLTELLDTAQRHYKTLTVRDEEEAQREWEEEERETEENDREAQASLLQIIASVGAHYQAQD